MFVGDWRMKHLFTVRWAFVHRTDGLTLTPGVNEEMADSIVGRRLRLVLPDKSEVTATITMISPLCQAPDRRLALAVQSFPETVTIPQGTEVFLLDE